MAETTAITAGAGAAVLVPVLANNRFDEALLTKYLAARIPEFRGECSVRQFQGGFSNPTFHLQTADRAFVLRKKPPGQLLQSAHAVDREYKVIAALQKTDVPVPRVYLLCEDESIIGTMFYVMDYVEGRVYPDRLLPGCTPEQRRDMYEAMNDVLARLHLVDYRAVGLEDFGKPTGYIARQVSRWSNQYVASAGDDDLPAMNELMKWLPAHLPKTDEATIAHGDYRIGNLLFHPTESKVVAVLDWELSTIGHPLGDLAYCCTAYHLTGENRGFAEHDLVQLGIPSEAEFLEGYRRRVGRADIPNWTFFIVFALFRSAAILAGVYRRSVDGQGVDARMAEAKQSYREIAARAWAIASHGS